MITYAETHYETLTKTGRPIQRKQESCEKSDIQPSRSCLRKKGLDQNIENDQSSQLV